MIGRRKRLSIVGAVVLAMVSLAVVGRQWQAKRSLQNQHHQQPSISTATPDAAGPRLNFRAALNALDSIIEAVNDEDWQAAEESFDEFQQSAEKLPTPELKNPDVSFALIDFFNLYRVQLERAIDGEEPSRAIFACNQLGSIIWDLRVQMNRTTLPELGRLHYLSRDLQYWADIGDETMLKVRAHDLEKTWNDLRPVVIDRKGRDVAEQFDSLVNQLRGARSVDDYREVAPEIGNTFRQVELIFSDIR